MRLIDADALMMPINASWRDAGLHSEDYGKIKRWIKNAPTIEAEPVKHGEWRDYPIADGCLQCSICGVLRIGGPSNFCPNCGAKMDAEEGEPHEQN